MLDNNINANSDAIKIAEESFNESALTSRDENSHF